MTKQPTKQPVDDSESRLPLEPVRNFRRRVIIWLALCVLALIGSTPAEAKLAFCLSMGLLLGSFPQAHLADGAFRWELYVLFLRVRKKRWKLERFVQIETGLEDRPFDSMANILKLGELLNSIWGLFDACVPWLGGDYKIWLRSSSNKRVLAWQGSNDAQFQRNLDLLRLWRNMVSGAGWLRQARSSTDDRLAARRRPAQNGVSVSASIYSEVEPMTRIVVDAILLDKLGNLSQVTELCDHSGRVLAQVVPVSGAAPSSLCEAVPTSVAARRREGWAEFRRDRAAALRQDVARLHDAAIAGNRELIFFTSPVIAAVRALINELMEAEDTEGNTLMVLNQVSDALRNDAGSSFCDPVAANALLTIVDRLATAAAVTPDDARHAYRQLRQLGLKPFVPVLLDAPHDHEAEELPD